MRRLATILFTVPMAAFGFLHFGPLEFSIDYVPDWLPIPAFWVYFAGVGLLAFALSVALGKLDRLAGYALALELLLFVVLIHIPKAATGDFLGIIATLRDIGMAGGALLFAEGFARDRYLPFVSSAYAKTRPA